ncbi:hypothetical protein Ciccas_007342 [Cichlidogyrus casuarinus]|uniref:Uncharacterized protein n=1 Tax=Cichlidogyrus casuarinus TaxID=1844966 RepID=A0ABD2Q5R7_9PLAT
MNALKELNEQCEQLNEMIGPSYGSEIGDSNEREVRTAAMIAITYSGMSRKIVQLGHTLCAVMSADQSLNAISLIRKLRLSASALGQSCVEFLRAPNVQTRKESMASSLEHVKGMLRNCEQLGDFTLLNLGTLFKLMANDMLAKAYTCAEQGSFIPDQEICNQMVQALEVRFPDTKLQTPAKSNDLSRIASMAKPILTQIASFNWSSQGHSERVRILAEWFTTLACHVCRITALAKNSDRGHRLAVTVEVVQLLDRLKYYCTILHSHYCEIGAKNPQEFDASAKCWKPQQLDEFLAFANQVVSGSCSWFML